MAFKVRKTNFRRWPVTVELQVCDAHGQVTKEQHQFIGLFKPFTEKDVEAARVAVFGPGDEEAQAKAAAKRSSAEIAALEAQYYARLMSGWEVVTDEDGTEIPYSDTALTALCTGEDGPAIRRGLAGALLELRFGLAPAKNGETSPAPGPEAAAGEAATS